MNRTKKKPDEAVVAAHRRDPKPWSFPVQHSVRSSSTQAQLNSILAALRKGPKTTDALRAAGCYQVSARIFGLRALGFTIVTERFNGWAADGLKHFRISRYKLVEVETVLTPSGKSRSRRSGAASASGGAR